MLSILKNKTKLNIENVICFYVGIETKIDSPEELKKKKKDIVHETSIKQASIEEVRQYVNSLQEAENNRFTLRPKKKSFFQKVKTCWEVIKG